MSAHMSAHMSTYMSAHMGAHMSAHICARVGRSILMVDVVFDTITVHRLGPYFMGLQYPWMYGKVFKNNQNHEN